MDFIDHKLQIIENCLQTNTYQSIETERIELKNLAGGWGDDWYKSVCAFLNTNGGAVIIGVSDNDRQKPPTYKFTGYTNSKNNETHLTEELHRKFTDVKGQPIPNLQQKIDWELRDFHGGIVAIVYVEALDDTQKYCYYNNIAYVRRLTGDHKLTSSEIAAHEELKLELIRYPETEKIPNAQITDLNVGVLNEYINKYNTGKKRGETLKVDIESALSFLEREGFVRDEQPTLLGILVCGDDPYHFLQGRCQADCYVLYPKSQQIANDQESIQDTIVPLIQRSFNFVWRNIHKAIVASNAGTIVPEYPESLLRESLNNAFAHRDYQDDRFVIIELKPGQHLLVRNPGRFEQRQRINVSTSIGEIRRIIPIQVARNPKLTHLLKSFAYWEGKGRGLSALTDACLDNEIDLPYYVLHENEIQLYIPTGKVYDSEMEYWLNSFSGYIDTQMGRDLSEEERILLAFFKKSQEQNRLNRYTILITADNNHNNAIASLEQAKLVFKNLENPRNDLYPVYQVNPILLQKDFRQELQQQFGENVDALSSDAKAVLNAIYWHEHFGKKNSTISASAIGTFLYLKDHKKIVDIKQFNNHQRKIRNVFNQLEDKNFIVRKDGTQRIDKGSTSNFRLNTTAASNTLFN